LENLYDHRIAKPISKKKEKWVFFFPISRHLKTKIIRTVCHWYREDNQISGIKETPDMDQTCTQTWSIAEPPSVNG
jgi:hypothetical protein